MTHRRTLLRSGAVLASAAVGAPAFAATWPSQALRIIIPFGAGGTSDVIARLISKPLGDLLGQSVVVENRIGAGGNVGAAAVANATDGHTMLLTDLGALSLTPLVTPQMPFKTDMLTGVTMAAYAPHILAAHPSVPAANLKELVEFSKRTKVNVASAGGGTPNHLGMTEIAMATGMKWTHIPYKGGAPAINDTVAGVCHVLLNGMLATYPQVQNGRLKILGVSKATRVALISDVPTIAEQGVKGYESGSYQGVVPTTGTPKAHIDKLSAALIQVIRSPDVRAKFAASGAEALTSTPKDTDAFINKDRTRWADVIRRAGKELDGNA